VGFLPSDPLPVDPEYFFYFSNSKIPVRTRKPNAVESFDEARPYFVNVVVKDADGHSFTSDIARVVIEDRHVPMALIVSVLAAGGGAGFAGMKVLRRGAMKRLSYRVEKDRLTRGVAVKPPNAAVDAAFHFRVEGGLIELKTKCAGSIVKEVRVLR